VGDATAIFSIHDKKDYEIHEIVQQVYDALKENGERRLLEVKKGDKVLFGKYSGQTVKVDGEELLVMREEDIMGIVE
jgi:chaperonin GroES